MSVVILPANATAIIIKERGNKLLSIRVAFNRFNKLESHLIPLIKSLKF